MNPIGLLALSGVALLVGPTLATVGASLRPLRAAVDGFTVALVSGVCVASVLPHAVGVFGLAGVALIVAGAGLPWILGRLSRGPTGAVGLALAAVAVHAVLDGAVLSAGADGSPLGWAVVGHRLPVGFALVVAARGSVRGVWWLAAALVSATVVGFVAGPAVVSALPHGTSVALEAIVAGALLHVVFGHHHIDGSAAGGGHAEHSHGCDHAEHSHGCDHQAHAHGHNHHAHGHDHHAHDHDHHGAHDHDPDGPPFWGAAGALVGLLVLAVGVRAETHAHPGDAHTFASTLGLLIFESAPALLLGYALAGVVPLVLSPTRTAALARGGRVAQALRGVGFGLPLPICSCGVLPLYASLVRRGAPATAAMAFFVATPELGLDAVLLSVPLLGSSLTVARVVAAFAVAVLVALLVGRAAPTPADDGRAACDDADAPPARLGAGLRFGFVEVFDHTMPWIALGLIIAALAEPLLSHEAIEGIPPVVQVPLAALVGVPIYVCASGATPIAALALHKGLTSGAAVAFLIAGPATNITTFGVLARLHGRRLALLFGCAVTALAIIAGWMVDALAVPAAPLLEAGGMAPDRSWLDWLCVGALAALTAASLFRQGPRGALRQIFEPLHDH